MHNAAVTFERPLEPRPGHVKLQLRKESSVLLGGRTAREDESVRDQAAAAAVMKTGGGVEPPSAAAFNRCHLISEGSSRTLRDTASLLHADIIHFSSGSISPPEEHPARLCLFWFEGGGAERVEHQTR